MKTFKLLAAVAAVSLAMTGCATTKSVVSDEVTTLPSYETGEVSEIVAGAMASGEVNFPEIDKSRFSTNNYKGSWPNWDNVAQVEHGMSKDQLYNLLGRPHFGEGLFNVKKWDYVFNYRDAGEHKVCQMQIHFDKDMLVKGFYWKGQDCEKQASPKNTPVQQTIVNNIIQQMPAPEVATLKETFELSADALFAFDKFGVNDIKAGGREKLDRLAAAIKAYENEGRVGAFVVGHTDRLGDDSYNFDLSKKRADTIVGYLLSRGVKPVSLSAFGAGEMMPVKECASGTRQQLIDCLQPNRRVEVQIYSYK